MKLRKLPDKSLASALWLWFIMMLKIKPSSQQDASEDFRRGARWYITAQLCYQRIGQSILQVGKYKVDNFGAVRMSPTQLLQQSDTATELGSVEREDPAWKRLENVRTKLSLENSATTSHHPITAEGLLWWFDLYQGWGSGWLWAQPRPQFERE